MSGPMISEEIFRQYAVIPRLQQLGCLGIRCEVLRNKRKPDILCTGPTGREFLIEVKCPRCIDHVYKAVGQLIFYGADYPNRQLVLALPLGMLNEETLDIIRKRCNTKIMRLPYPDLSRMTFREQVLPASSFK